MFIQIVWDNMSVFNSKFWNFNCYTGKRVTGTSTSPTANNNNLVPTESDHNTGSTPDPCNATLDAIMLGELDVQLLASRDANYWTLTEWLNLLIVV